MNTVSEELEEDATEEQVQSAREVSEASKGAKFTFKIPDRPDVPAKLKGQEEQSS